MGNSNSVPEGREARREAKSAKQSKEHRRIQLKSTTMNPAASWAQPSSIRSPTTDSFHTEPSPRNDDQLDHYSYDELLRLQLQSTSQVHLSPGTTLTPSRSQTTLGMSPKAIDIQSALSILEELKKTATPEELVALHRALLPTRSETPTIAEIRPSIGNVVRSISTENIPGTASRKISHTALVVKNDSSPAWDPEILDASPLAKIEKLNDESGHLPPRSQTPAEFAHLGTMQLGTLSITNGAPISPGPSLVEAVRHKPSRILVNGQWKDEEYFTAEESGPDTDQEEEHRKHKPSPINTTFGPLLQPTTSGAEQRSGSPLKSEIRTSSYGSSVVETPAVEESSVKEKKLPKVKSRNRLSKAVPVKKRASRLIDFVQDELPYSDEEAMAPPRASFHSRNHSELSAEDLAMEYQAGLPDSPFTGASPNPNVSPPLEPVSLDEEFSEDVQLSEEPQEVDPHDDRTGYRSDSWSKTITAQTALGSHPPDLSEIPAVRTLPRLPKHKSDSGYSSATASFYAPDDKIHRPSTSNAANQRFEPSVSPEPAMQDTQDENWPLSSTHTPQPQTPEDPYQTLETSPTSPVESNVPEISPSASRPSLPDSKKKSWMGSKLRLSRLISSDDGSTKSKVSLVETVNEEPSKEPKTPKKLQKRRPFSTQTAPPVDFSIPRVPSAMVLRLTDRTNSFEDRPSESARAQPMQQQRTADSFEDRPSQSAHPQLMQQQRAVELFDERPRQVHHRQSMQPQPVKPFQGLSNEMVRPQVRHAQSDTRPKTHSGGHQKRRSDFIQYRQNLPMRALDSNQQYQYQHQHQNQNPSQHSSQLAVPEQLSRPSSSGSSQRRMSFGRFGSGKRPKSLYSQHADPNSDDDLDIQLYPALGLDFASVTTSIGKGPYDMIPQKDQPQRQSVQRRVSSGERPPIPPTPNNQPSFRGKNRPRSFHGRSAQLPRLGESQFEGPSEQQHNRMQARGRPGHSPDGRPARPKSMGAPRQRPSYSEHDHHPLPQLAPKHWSEHDDQPLPQLAQQNDWTEQEQIWRQRREGANRAAPRSNGGPYPMMSANSTGMLDLPTIPTKPRHRPALPGRPVSEIVPHRKSQPELRTRYYAQQRINQVPVQHMNPHIAKRTEFVSQY
ncbi:hypothetical protein BT63DRAFT_438706 [Microthyrium microscopicum]|uniref:Uncharacterized protein n=1 Tax=Microthyrium microscopicum TaxID=703497 RepID=A0A6A6UG90_9PEZI|nr:hypothetical protein BT63DRAFT_438706 [Microthyrium microscopicum]